MDLAAFLPGQGQAKKVKLVVCKILSSILVIFSGADMKNAKQ